VPVRRGDNRLSGSERNRERSGDDLRLLPVGRDVDIGRADVFDQLFRTYKAIDRKSGDRKRQAASARALQPFAVTLALAPADMRMRHAGDDVNHVRLSCQNRRQRLNDVFNALVGRQQTRR
jgi:hypothetical protein